MKRLQNRIAESVWSLPVMMVYGLLVWLLGGLVIHGWWPQLACYGASVYLLVEMNNSNALIRVRSRMVSCIFIALSCMACTLLGSLSGGVVQLCLLGALLILFSTYQNPQSVGRVFYAGVFLGVGSMFFVRTLWLLPVLWVLMATQLQSLSWRTWLASLIGVLTPYWFFSLWFIYTEDFTPLADHVSGLWRVDTIFRYDYVTVGQVLVFVMTLGLTVAGMVHFWHRSYEDKIRIRLLYGFFSYMGLFALLLVAVMPQCYDPFMRLAFICCCPLAAHFLTFTSTRVTNIVFFVIIALVLMITALNLWMPSLSF